MLSQFIPKSITEWTYIILIVVLVVTLILFYKGVMKCKSIIESYNNEIRDYKRCLSVCRNFVYYIDEHYSDIIPEFCVQSDTTYNDFYKNIIEVDINA